MISQERNGRTYTYLYDGHGSVVGLMSESGSVTDTYTYDAFGNLLKSTGRTENNYRYCGEQFDSTTGLYYLRARYMDTNTGRFISQDSYAGSTYDPVSLHKYLYANSNPVMYIDPSGYMTKAELDTGMIISSILDAAYQMANSAALATGMKIIAALVTVVDITLFTYIITDYILDNINDIASGSKTSVDVNAEVREEAVDGATGGAADGAGSGGAAPNPDDNGNKNKKNKNEPPETDNLKWSKKAKKLFDKLSPEQKKMAIKTIMDFVNGKSNHNNHPLFHDRVGQWALDIIGMGKGRGGGRIIYEIVDGVINIIEIITGHNY